MLTIDFLPASYQRERRRRRRRTLRRWSVVLCVVLMLAGALDQRRRIIDLRNQQTLLRSQLKTMTDRLPPRSELEKTLHALRARANLVSYLRLRIAPSQILAGVTNTLPHHVSLTEFHAEYESAEVSPTRDSASGLAARATAGKKSVRGAQKTDHRLPFEEDTERLFSLSQKYRTVVTLTGMAPDDVAVSEYLANLKATELFDDVRLLFTTQQEYFGQPRRAFEIRLLVKRPEALLTAVAP